MVELERPDHVDDPHDPDEPRTLRLTPHGPRWDEPAILRLEAALATVTGPDGIALAAESTESTGAADPDTPEAPKDPEGGSSLSSSDIFGGLSSKK